MTPPQKGWYAGPTADAAMPNGMAKLARTTPDAAASLRAEWQAALAAGLTPIGRIRIEPSGGLTPMIQISAPHGRIQWGWTPARRGSVGQMLPAHGSWMHGYTLAEALAWKPAAVNPDVAEGIRRTLAQEDDGTEGWRVD